MVRAAATGAIDFTVFDPREPRCWRSLYWVLEEINTQKGLQVLEARQRHLTGLLGHGRLTQKSFRDTQDTALKVLERIVKRHYPWQKEEKTGILNDPKGSWEAVFGKMDDPAVQAAIAETIAYLRRNR